MDKKPKKEKLNSKKTKNPGKKSMKREIFFKLKAVLGKKIWLFWLFYQKISHKKTKKIKKINQIEDNFYQKC